MAVQKVMNLLPEYQEKFLKDLLANIYQVDEETGEITGIAATSPLYGTPVMDESGNQMYVGADGAYVSDPSQAVTDQYGEPILAVEGGVAAPDVIGFTEAQQRALEMGEDMMGAYQPYLESSESLVQEGAETLRGTTGAYDPTSYKDYYDPFVEDVIAATGRDFDEARAKEAARIGSQAAGSGAFGSRADFTTFESLGNITQDELAQRAKLRSAAYTAAQQQAQSAFENQQKRGQNAAQLFQGLGTSMGALGEAAQNLGQSDVNALYNLGSLEQNQLQREYDVQRAGQLEEAYEPFARFSYMRDILSGVPSSGTSLAAAATPQASPLANVLAGANIYSSAQGGGNIFGGLGSLYPRAQTTA